MVGGEDVEDSAIEDEAAEDLETAVEAAEVQEGEVGPTR